jgi:zinc D-Ala-D-Ala carboxypeptidase
MSRGQPTRAAPRRLGSVVLTVLVAAGAGGVALLVDRTASPSRNDATATPTVTIGTLPSTTPRGSSAPGSPDGLPLDQHGGLGAADGVVPAGVTVFADAYPAVAKLNRSLLRALRQAATAAARDGVTLYVDSGWRSAKYQEQLLEQAIVKYGSERAALRWVATPSTSAHVSGDAVDIGPATATDWLSHHGAQYGLCAIYRNEPWHYELRPAAVDDGCPRMYADPTEDPRMRG